MPLAGDVSLSRIVGVSLAAPLLGTLAIAPFALLDSETRVTIEADISGHLDGNPALLMMTADVSLDGGQTWTYWGGWGRTQGDALTLDRNGLPITKASLTTLLPPGAGRQFRAALTVDRLTTTFGDIVVA